jgi:hypothetical protein
MSYDEPKKRPVPSARFHTHMRNIRNLHSMLGDEGTVLCDRSDKNNVVAVQVARRTTLAVAIRRAIKEAFE